MNSWKTDAQVAFTYNGVSLSVSIVADDDANYYTISNESPNFNTAFEALKNKDYEALIEAVKPIQKIFKAVAGVEDVTVSNDSVYYKGVEMHGALTERILEFARLGVSFDPLAKFMQNLMQNPSKVAREELFLFLESSSTPMPITEDGYFLAYKKVNHNFRDLYSNRVDYSVGQTPEMDRKDVNDDRRVTCSDGLHFCSMSYLPSYHGGDFPVVIVKINPADVVSIPYDYNNAKGRACRMEVIGVHTKGNSEPAWTSGYSETDDNRSVKIDDQEDLDYYDYNEDNFEYFGSRQAARERRDHYFNVYDDLQPPKVVDLWKVSKYIHKTAQGGTYYQGPSTARWALYFYD